MRARARGFLSTGLFLAVLLIAAGCDEFPGREVIGVRLGPNAGTIEVTKVLCPGDRVDEVSLVPAPEGVPRDDSILWQITSEDGSTQSSYVIGVTPPGFVENVPLSRNLGPELGLATTIDTFADAEALMAFEPRELRTDELLTPDGYMDSAQFEARHLERCEE